MKFLVITHVNHIQNGKNYFGYGPYVREMNIWLKYVDEVIIIAPLLKGNPTAIDLEYKHQKIDFRTVSDFSFTSLKSNFISLYKLPKISWNIFLAMKQADHIHLRCPGNMGLVGCFIQILFPKKIKTAKYAGNWDPKSKQPWTYKLQKYILGNTFLTRNMQVLVYGDWKNQSKNIKSFFTATYSESDKLPMKKMDLKEKIDFIFVGTLTSGKNPLYSVQLVESLFKIGYNVNLQLYGEGLERKALEDYIALNNLSNFIQLKGNQNQKNVTEAYQNNHFVILSSKSEGWPKVIAEGMFWGCIPIATSVSCVPFMLDYGKRGVLLEMILERDIQQLEAILKSEIVFDYKRKEALKWSQNYTTDVFEKEIKLLLNK